MVKSPCIKDCNFDESSGICLGCRRTEEEFKTWRGMTDDEKLDVLKRIQREKECLIGNELKKN